MPEITMTTHRKSYRITIGAGLLSDISRYLPDDTRKLVISDSTVAPLYLEQLEAAIGGSIESIVIPAGETFKTVDTLQDIWDELANLHFPRDGILIALGGGVIGDITGFAAASWMRGIRYFQVPTTLLAMVDASVGGKTAVNLEAGKNLIGAFHQPEGVLIDTQLLRTLPEREFSAGMAEVIKSALLAGEEFFTWIESNAAELSNRSNDLLAEAIERSCRLKADIVSLDETEQGQRAVLNLGHTFAHAMETGLGHGEWLHGEAVAAGLVHALRLSEALHGLSPDLRARLTMLLQAFQLPTSAPDRLSDDRILELMQGDKKADSRGLRLVTLAAAGDPRISRVEPAVLRTALSRD